MNEYETTIQRTWVQICVDYGFTEAAAIAIDSDIVLKYNPRKRDQSEDESFFAADTLTVQIQVPTEAYGCIITNEAVRESFEVALRVILEGRIIPLKDWWLSDNSGELRDFKVDVLLFEYSVKLMIIEDGWKDGIRNLLYPSQASKELELNEELDSDDKVLNYYKTLTADRQENLVGFAGLLWLLIAIASGYYLYNHLGNSGWAILFYIFTTFFFLWVATFIEKKPIHFISVCLLIGVIFVFVIYRPFSKQTVTSFTTTSAPLTTRTPMLTPSATLSARPTLHISTTQTVTPTITFISNRGHL